MDNRSTPADTDVPGGFPVTPSALSEQSTIPTASREPSVTRHTVDVEDTTNLATPTPSRPDFHSYFAPGQTMTSEHRTHSSNHTGAGVPAQLERQSPKNDHRMDRNPSQSNMSPVSSGTGTSEDSIVEKMDSRYMPLKAAPTGEKRRPPLESRNSIKTEEDLFRVLSRRRTNASGKSTADMQEEHDEIERLMSRMFGKARQENSEEEKTRHSGVVFRDLTVKGVGLGASLQPTVGDVFLGLPRMIKTLFTKGAKAATGKPPVRELLSHFDGCVKPGEMLLVLGRPGSGCSTFLKAFCNQREGFEAVKGDVTYGGTDARRMKKDFRGEVIYNPEDDLHYATLTVKRTLMFALKTRTPGKESRMEGESRADYMNEFMRVVTKLFWIEHTLGTKVGDEFVRGVSGGEKKRVSIAEGEYSVTCVAETNEHSDDHQSIRPGLGQFKSWSGCEHRLGIRPVNSYLDQHGPHIHGCLSVPGGRIIVRTGG